MKKIFLPLVFVAAVSFGANAQDKGSVGIGTVSPDQSAVLDIQSSSKGLLVPRMTETLRNEINQPAKGLLIYQTDKSEGFFFYNGNTWDKLSANEAKSVAAANPDNWSLLGNSGTTASNYLGTSDAQPLRFGVGGIKAGIIDAGNANTLLGYNTGLVMTGNNNAGLGSNTLTNNTTGSLNMAIGTNSLNQNVSGGFNVGVGASTLYNNTGDNNVAIGTFAMFTKTTGNGNVAIGDQAGFTNAAGTGNIFIGQNAGFSETGSGKMYIANSATETPLVYGDFAAKYVTIGDVTPALRNQGTATGGYNLLVKGGILTEKVKVALATAGTDWADYVFEPSYKLMSLEAVEAFTKQNKHLPNVPSADEMVNSGLDVAQTSKMFMEKIEELTLYMIEMNKEIKALKEINAVLQQRVDSIK